MDNKKTPQKNRVYTISVALFLIILAIGCVASFIMPLRPTESLVEQRQLTVLPSASADSIMDGSYFADLGTWYSDSFPGRETMITMNDRIRDLYGIKSDAQMIGSALVADEIPDFEENTSTDESLYVEAEDPEDIVETEESVIEEVTPESIIEEPEEDNAGLNSEKLGELEPPNSQKMEAEIKQYIQQNLYVKDGAAHSLYYFSQKVATRYANILNTCAEELEGKANVYNILVPNSSGVVLSDEEMASLGGSNQSEAIHYFYSLYDKATGIESIDILKEHRGEYLYFRTDHHWTALSAYYVYTNFCKTKGFEPHELDYYKQVTFEPFLGSYYSSLKRSDMAANPDYITAYIPKGTNKMTYYDKKGKAVDYDIIHDVSKWSQYTKYNCFIGGDEPMQYIENPMLHHSFDSCLVIKESYGNCFVPFLVDHYRYVYVMDYRYCNKNVIDFVNEHGIDDVILINNISIIGSSSVLSKLESMLN